MITTVTLNTSIDKLYFVDGVDTNKVMRVQQVINTPGGKGLNVSKVATILGEQVNALGFIGGFQGDYLVSLLNNLGITNNFTSITGETRSCINIRDTETGEHTEFLEPGPTVSEQQINAFLTTYIDALSTSKIVTISGSVPKGVPIDFYNKLVDLAKEKRVPVLLDSSGDLLKSALSSKPTLIKPNEDEISQLAGKKLNRSQLIDFGITLQKTGIEYVVVSLGGEGALLFCDAGVYKAQNPNVNVINTVGSGDSMIAGFATGIKNNLPPKELLAYTSAVGCANTLQIPTGHVDIEDVKRLNSKIVVEKIR